MNDNELRNILLSMHHLFIYVRAHMREQLSLHILNKCRIAMRSLEQGECHSLDSFYTIITSDLTAQESLQISYAFNSNDLHAPGGPAIQKGFLSFMTEALDITCTKIDEKDYDCAYRLIDALHALPEMLAKGKLHASSYWNVFIKGNDLEDLFLVTWRRHFKPSIRKRNF
ncbi:hypothetical protein B5M42_017215 [Paenibacillus athensensis]|uniref:Uncharacterized protein n=1 Tax=Paenibacillus athensensis TaxID=1967502 RepID=A0A4Y8PT73_9BACL|nr:hypothetical protein [Paenibacillus athensensis]MCD1260544.1 hypothetical protein [Paenibacillus athensensis]